MNLNDISYIQKTFKNELDPKEATHSVLHFDGKL